MTFLNGIRAIYFEPGFKSVAKKTDTNKKPTPKRKTLEVIIDVVRNNDGINRKGILDLSGISDNCTDRCLPYLIGTGELTRKATGISGGHVNYAYSVVEE